MRRFLLTTSVIGLSLLMFLYPPFAIAANTHSADLERGSSQYFSRADNAVFTTDDWKIEAWINPESLPSVDNSNYIAGKLVGGSGDAAEFHLRLNNGGGTQKIILAWQDGVNPAFEVSYNTTLSLGTWYHIAGTRVRSTGRMIIFIDGVDVASAVNNTGATPDTDRSFAIGYADYGGAAEFFDGKIDEVRFWSTASTSVAYNACAVGNESGLVALWHLDNAETDSGPNSLTLTNNNSVTYSTDVAAALNCGAAAGAATRRRMFIFQ